MIISVIGAGSCNKEIYSIAEEVRKLIAMNGAVLVTGGLGGVWRPHPKGHRKKAVSPSEYYSRIINF